MATQLNLRKTQIGRETTPGTSVPATALLLNTQFATTNNPAIHYPNQQRGLLAEEHAGVQLNRMIDHTWATELTYEQVLYALNMGMMALVTGTGAGADKTWTFAPSPTGATVENAFTLEKRYTDGTTNFDFEYPFTIAKTLKASGRENGIWTMSADLLSAREVTAAITAAIAAPAVWEPAVFNLSKVFIDTTWAGLGTTQVLGQVYGVDWEFDTGLERRFYADGQLHFSRRTRNKRQAKLSLMADFGTQAQAFRDAVESRAVFYIRVECIGTVVAATNKKIQFDGKYVVDPTGAIQENQGEDVMTIPLVSRYDTTGAQDVRVTVINTLAALP